MRVFFACHRFPFPPNRGGKIRPFNMIRHLSQKHDVTVASIAHSQQELDEGSGLKEYCAEIYAETVSEPSRRLQAVAALPTSRPSSVAYFSSAKLRQRLKEKAQKSAFDAIVVHCAFAAQYSRGIPAKFRLLDFGDLDSGKWLDYSVRRSFPISWGYFWEFWKLRRYEKRLVEAFDYVTLTTGGELEEFHKLNIKRSCHVIPNGVDSNYFHPNGGPAEAKPVIVFLGRMDYFPNVDGVLYFVENILPRIRALVPEVEFRIIGSNPTAAVQCLRDIPGVLVTGHVPDVRPFLRDALVSVAPLRIARGTQNKILESMALGIPVVATPQAAKGIQAEAEEHLLVGADPEAFARQVINVLSSREVRANLSMTALKQVRSAHVWPRSMQILDDILTRGVQSPSI